ncbi:precorrin-2 dehydrogenase/sirohydrochlorin ferrochelatase family protein [Effusibacillus pohliae]|uniref:precorrin-2 dehydrogenase/sirohydrochlorin ferrochelatase family protein n=1 Tax=Effusibacillus pohliae TaxID=232270 RepID=UPI0003652190|nr:bifunctional precorrin-2 dehydrogenase/sirohydrochlorin ferrochelatase [Effusibacillus pohliae]
MMDKPFFGAFLDVAGRLCVVIGGGQVAERKVRSLLDCRARVRVVSPALTPGLEELAADGTIEYVARPYQPGDAKDAFLTIAATDSLTVNRQVVEEADAEGRLVNTVHAAAGGNLILPAVMRRGPLQVAISTSGTGPVLARLIREELEGYFGPEYERYLEKLAAIRTRLRQTVADEQTRADILRKIVRSNVRELLREGREAEADRTIRDIIEGRKDG